MMAYSMPLWTIFTKWPLPKSPRCTTQGFPPKSFAAIFSKIGRIFSQADLSPPGMSDGPWRAPSSPPEIPQPMK